MRRSDGHLYAQGYRPRPKLRTTPLNSTTYLAETAPNRPNGSKIRDCPGSVYYPGTPCTELSSSACSSRPPAANTSPSSTLPLLCSAAPESSVTASAPAASTAPASSAPALESAAASASAPDAGAGKRASGSAPDAHRYRWLGADNLKFPAPVDSLEARFPTPPGYQRVTAPPGTFGEWLRGLPLAAPGTPVLNNSGDVVYPGDDPYVAAVIAIDVGAGDLQQSSDAVTRLHAEWLWASDKPDAISYRSASKLDMPFSRWAKGQRLLPSGPNVFWVVKGKPHDATYNDFRQYIDAVMLWSNNVSLAMRASHVSDPAQLTAGDFFLQSRGKGHALLVLDVAQKPTGERVALLGQALQNPAQSMHVMRLGQATAWFSMRPPNAVLTPRGDEFSWADLSRLEPKKDE